MKIVIAGASAAGLYLAYNLAKDGLEVEVYERKERIDWPRRTLIVTSRLADILGFDPGEAILNRVSYMQLEAGGERVKLRLGSPDLIIERGKLFGLLADRARGEGARLYFGHELVGFYSVNGERGKIRCLVRRRQNGEVKEIEADYLVGADGALSKVKGLLLGAEGWDTWVKPGGHGIGNGQGASEGQVVNSEYELISGNVENEDEEISSGESSDEWQNRGEGQHPGPGLNRGQSLSGAQSLNNEKRLNYGQKLNSEQGMNPGQSPGCDGLNDEQSLNQRQKSNIGQRLRCAQSLSGARKLNFHEIMMAQSSNLNSVRRNNGKNSVTDLKALLQWRVELKGMWERKMGCSFGFEPDTCYVWFDPKRTPYFFWALPESDEVMAVGLIAERMDEAKKALASFLEEKMPGARRLEAQAGLTPLPRFVFRFPRLLFSRLGGSWRFSCRPENFRSQTDDKGDGSLRSQNSVTDTVIKIDYRLKELKDTDESKGNYQESLNSSIVLNRGQNGRDYDAFVRRITATDGYINRYFYSGKEILYSPMGAGDGSGSIFLVGDAASQVKATTVGGVVAGLRGAKAVASLILGRVEEARRELERLSCELNLHLLVRKILNRFGEDDYRRLLSLLRRDNGLASFISRHTRDDLASFFFNLILRYPRLAWIGLRSLL